MDLFLPEPSLPSWLSTNTYTAGAGMNQFSPSGLPPANFMNFGNQFQGPSTPIFWQCHVNIASPQWAIDTVSSPASLAELRSASSSSTDTDLSNLENGLVKPRRQEPVSPKIKRRREQNRLSQRTFRMRQAKNMSELAAKLQEQTEKYERLKQVVEELKRREPELFESLSHLYEALLSPPPEESHSKHE